MINAMKSDVEKRFGGDVNNVHLEIAHTNNLLEAQNFKEEVLKAFPEYTGEIYIDHLSLSVSCHIGAGSLALACSRKLSRS